MFVYGTCYPPPGTTVSMMSDGFQTRKKSRICSMIPATLAPTLERSVMFQKKKLFMYVHTDFFVPLLLMSQTMESPET